MIRPLIVALALSFASAPAMLEAQDARPKPAAKSKSKNKAPPKAKRGKLKAAKSKSAPARTAAADKPAASANAPAAAPESGGRAPNLDDASALAADANEAVRKEGGSEIKTVEFGGLDIEGQLKTPQMLYFLNRLRAEFSRPELPHRSFIPELQRGTKESAF